MPGIGMSPSNGILRTDSFLLRSIKLRMTTVLPLPVTTTVSANSRASGLGLKARCDSFVVETDVHHPTDLNLLYDLRLRAVLDQANSSPWPKTTSSGMSSEQPFVKKDSEALLCHWYFSTGESSARYHQGLAESLWRDSGTRGSFLGRITASGSEEKLCQRDRTMLKFGWVLSDQVARRLLKREIIPAQEKIYSVFEPHTRWIQKGKAGNPVELGFPVSIVEDEHQLVLTYRIMWTKQDVEAAVPIVTVALEKYPELSRYSFDKGYHSPENQKQFPELIREAVLPKKGK